MAPKIGSLRFGRQWRLTPKRQTIFVPDINHLEFQVGVELMQLISPFLQSRRGREISRADSFGRADRVTGFNKAGDRFIMDDVSRMLSLQGKKRGDTGGG